MRSTLNRVLILAQECRGKMVQNRTGIMDLQNKNNVLVAKQVSYRMLVPAGILGEPFYKIVKIVVASVASVASCRSTDIKIDKNRQNGLQIRNQRIFLRIVAPVKIYFRHFFENDIL